MPVHGEYRMQKIHAGLGATGVKDNIFHQSIAMSLLYSKLLLDCGEASMLKISNADGIRIGEMGCTPRPERLFLKTVSFLVAVTELQIEDDPADQTSEPWFYLHANQHLIQESYASSSMPFGS